MLTTYLTFSLAVCTVYVTFNLIGRMSEKIR